MENIAIRTALLKNGIRMWQLADALEIAPETLSRKLRYPLSDEETEKMIAAVCALSNKEERDAG